jgi:O-antigen/teichoic acid export membrane protein
MWVAMAARKRKTVAVINTLRTFAKPLVGALVAYAFLLRAEAVVGGYLLTALVFFIRIEKVHKGIVQGAKQHPARIDRGSENQDHRIGKEIIQFAWPLFLVGLFSWMHQFCDRWSLMAFHGPDVVGAFAVISQLAVYPLIFGTNFLGSYLAPVAYEKAGDVSQTRSIRPANTLLFVMTGIYLVGAAGLIIFFAGYHHELVLLVSNHRYTAISYLLPWLTMAWALYYLGQIMSAFGFAAVRPRLYLRPALISGVTAVMATFYLSMTCGPVGVVAGLGIAGGVYAAWCLRICLRLSRTPTQGSGVS